MTKTILVIEDERALLTAIKAKLETSGFTVVTARSVMQAENALKIGKNIAAIWLDHYLLGGENGLELVNKLKASDSKWKNIPIFVVSNTASEDKVQSYIKLGVKKYFTKSDYRLEDIIKEIQEL